MLVAGSCGERGWQGGSERTQRKVGSRVVVSVRGWRRVTLPSFPVQSCTVHPAAAACRWPRAALSQTRCRCAFGRREQPGPIQAFFEGGQHLDWLMCGVERLGTSGTGRGLCLTPCGRGSSREVPQ